jgi:hypothetical protein
MSTSAINDPVLPSPLAGTERLAPPRPSEARPVDGRPDASGDVDAVQALLALGEELQGAPAQGLADQLLDFLAPRPRNPQTLTQSRIVPLLGLAADLIGGSSRKNNDLVMLGATALEQELRMQRALADRRATLVSPS